MPSTSYDDFTAGVRAIGARTDSVGSAATDLGADEDRLINHILTEGYLTSGAFEVAADSPASMDVIVGSGTAKADVYVVEGDDDGQHPYLVRLDDATVTVTLDAADGSNPRIDEIWLVVTDAAWDSGSTSLPRIGYRKGDAAGSPSAPGPDSSWKAAVKLATIAVGAGASSISSGNITDERAGSSSAVPLPGAWEVDGATEVASQALTSSYATIATVNLDIPAGWGSWKCEARATFRASSGVSGDRYSARIDIDGTAQQAIESVGTSVPDLDENGAVGGYRTGMTTTGSRAVTLMAVGKTPTTGASFTDVYLYARAVRTS